MENPCYRCEKYRLFGEHLEEIIPGKPPVDLEASPAKKTKRTSNKNKVCTVKHCTRPVQAKGMCGPCNARKRYYNQEGKTWVPILSEKSRAALANKTRKEAAA